MLSQFRPSVRLSVRPLHGWINQQESPAVADKPARRLRKVCTVYVSSGVVSCIASLPIYSAPMVPYYVLYSNCVCKMHRFGDTRLLKLP